MMVCQQRAVSETWPEYRGKRGTDCQSVRQQTRPTSRTDCQSVRQLVGPIIAWNAVVIFALALVLVSAPDGTLASDGLAAADVSTMGLPTNGEPPQDEPALRPFFASRDQDRGIRIDPVYYGECFTNARGGISTAGATQYEALLDLPLTLDFERLRVPVPGKSFCSPKTRMVGV